MIIDISVHVWIVFAIGCRRAVCVCVCVVYWNSLSIMFSLSPSESGRVVSPFSLIDDYLSYELCQ